MTGDGLRFAVRGGRAGGGRGARARSSTAGPASTRGSPRTPARVRRQVAVQPRAPRAGGVARAASVPRRSGRALAPAVAPRRHRARGRLRLARARLIAGRWRSSSSPSWLVEARRAARERACAARARRRRAARRRLRVDAGRLSRRVSRDARRRRRPRRRPAPVRSPPARCRSWRPRPSSGGRS